MLSIYSKPFPQLTILVLFFFAAGCTGGSGLPVSVSPAETTIASPLSTASATSTPTIPSATATALSTPTAARSPDPTLQQALCQSVAIPTLTRRQIIAPILLYHHIGSANLESDGISDSRYNVDVNNFLAQIDLLKTLGYNTVGVSQIASAMLDQGSLPERPIAITFDDGWEDQFLNAVPPLQERGLMATFYIVSTYPGGQDFITWDQLAQMAADGMEIGSHSRTHAHLPKLEYDALWSEIRVSKVELEKKLKVAVPTFSYPYGELTQNPDLATLVSRAGYRAAVGTDPGTIQYQIFYLRRLEVTGSETLAEFAASLPWNAQGTGLCPSK